MRKSAIQNYRDPEVFSSSQAAIVTFLGGPMAAGFVLFHNFLLVGRRFFSWVILAPGILLGPVFFVSVAFMAFENGVVVLPFLGAFMVIFPLLIAVVVEVFLENDLKSESARVKDISWLLSVMVAGACLVLQLSVIFLGILYLAASFMSRPDGLA